MPALFDYLATFTWAVSGAVVGIRKRYDLVGVFVIAVLSSTGGSLIRDGLFLHRTPPVLTDAVYLPLILAATIVTSAFRRRISGLPVVDRLVDMMDAIGTPAFAVVGMQLSLRAGIPLPGVVMMGMINGFGGGLLRDVVVNDAPAVLQPGQYAATAAAAMCVLFLTMTLGYGVATDGAAWGIVALYVVIRMLTIRYNLRTQPVLPEERRLGD